MVSEIKKFNAAMCQVRWNVSTQGTDSAATADRGPAPVESCLRWHIRWPLVNLAGLDDDVVLLQHGNGFGWWRRSRRGPRRWPGVDVVMGGDSRRGRRSGQRRWGTTGQGWFRTGWASVFDERRIGDDGRRKRAEQECYQLAEQGAQDGLVDYGRGAVVGPIERVLDCCAEHVVQVHLRGLEGEKWLR